MGDIFWTHSNSVKLLNMFSLVLIFDFMYKISLAKFEEGIFIEYSSSSNAHRVFNNRTSIIEESVHVTFDETKPQKTGNVVFLILMFHV